MAIIGVSKPKYAIYDVTGGVVSYSDGATLGKATEINLEIETSDDNNLYADNAIAETDKTFSSGSLTISTDDLSDDVAAALLGITPTSIGVITGVTDTGVDELIYDDQATTPYVGVGFIVKKKVGGVYKWRAIVLTKVMFDVPADAATTQGETIEWQVPELTATVMRDDSTYHAWKKEATFTTETQAEAYIEDRLNF